MSARGKKKAPRGKEFRLKDLQEMVRQLGGRLRLEIVPEELFAKREAQDRAHRVSPTPPGAVRQ